jgi:large subunit ribosomal protein LP1
MSSADIAKSAIPYAMCLLADAGVEITEERVSAILVAAGLEVESIWISVFVKSLKNDDILALCKSVSSGAGSASSGAAPVAAAAQAAPAAAAPAAGKKAAPKEEEPEEDMGFSLFD